MQELGIDNAVVIIRRADMYGPHWYVRNDPAYTQSVLYAAPKSQAEVALLRARFHGRAFYVYDAHKRPALRALP